MAKKKTCKVTPPPPPAKVETLRSVITGDVPEPATLGEWIGWFERWTATNYNALLTPACRMVATSGNTGEWPSATIRETWEETQERDIVFLLDAIDRGRAMLAKLLPDVSIPAVPTIPAPTDQATRRVVILAYRDNLLQFGRAKAEGGPWSQPDAPSEWCKVFGHCCLDTLHKRVRNGTIRIKPESTKSWRIHVDDLPAGHPEAR